MKNYTDYGVAALAVPFCRGKYLFRHVAPSEGINHQFFRQLYPSIISDITVSLLYCVPLYTVYIQYTIHSVYTVHYIQYIYSTLYTVYIQYSCL